MTVDWHDHARVIADYLIFIKLTHVLGGVLCRPSHSLPVLHFSSLTSWDFVLNLDFEYSILRGKRRLTWTSPFLALDSDGSHAIDCQVFAYLTLLFASALIALRVTALWEYNKIVVAIAFTSWLANVIIYVYSTAKSRGYWVEGECVIQHTFHSNISIFSTLASDFLLLTLMLVGLLRWNIRSGDIFQLMYAQGLAWVLVVALAEIPPAVFIALNLERRYEYGVPGCRAGHYVDRRMPHIPWTCQFPSANCTPLETAAMDQLREPQRGSFGSSLHLVRGTRSAGGAQVGNMTGIFDGTVYIVSDVQHRVLYPKSKLGGWIPIYILDSLAYGLWRTGYKVDLIEAAMRPDQHAL
ncbi:hypothetical protein EDB85DRAFT_1890990 [Lactarius pseudohatsudake]|nr:hypothetical protein EDB85DRAFT_1890990 [Lactarius pseudohatsudake]